MRAVILALAIGLAAASYSGKNEVYRSGKEYNYDIISDVLTGIPHLSEQNTGMRIKCRATMQMGSGSRVVIKMDDVELFTAFTEVVQPSDPSQPLSEVNWKPESGEQLHELKDQLSRPCKFRYEQGVVSKLECDADEPEWSTNIKKGVVNLLQLNLGQQDELEDLTPELKDLLRHSTPHHRRSQQQPRDEDQPTTIYRVMEEGLLGECESIYQVNNYQRDQPMINKIVNYDNCKSQVRFEEGLLTSLTVRPYNNSKVTKKPLVTVLSHTDIKIEGDRNNFLIKQVTAHGEQILMPLDEGHGEIVTTTFQQMSLRDVREVQSFIQPPRHTKVMKEGLMMTIPQKDSFQQDRSYSLRDNEERVTAVKSLLRDIVEGLTPKLSLTLGSDLRYLMELLQQCNSQDLLTMLREYQPACQHQSSKAKQNHECKKYTVLYDMLSTVANDQVLEVYKELINDQTMNPFEGSVRLNIFALHMKPSPDAIKMLLPSSELYRLRAVTQSPMLQRNLLLTLGTSLHKYRRANEIKPQPVDVYIPLMKQAVRELTDLYKNTQQESSPERKEMDGLAVLKCISNSGLPDFLPMLEIIMNDRQQFVSHRIQAVYSVDRMPRNVNRKIHSMMMPFSNNPNEHLEVRRAAVVEILNKAPSYGTLQLLVHSLRRETSTRHGAFVFNYMHKIINSKRPVWNDVRENLKRLQLQMKPFVPNWFMNNIQMYDMIIDEFQTGMPLEMLFNNKDDSVIPNAFWSKLSALVFGKDFSVVEGSLDLNGLQDILSRVFGPRSVLSDRSVLQDIKDIAQEMLRPIRQPDLGLVEDKVDNIIKKIGLNQLPQSSKEMIMTYIKVLGNEVSFMKVSKDDFMQWIHQGYIPNVVQLKEFIQMLQQGLELDYVKTLVSPSSMTFPTLTGLCSNFNLTVTAVTNIRGNIRFSGNPFPFKSGPNDFTAKFNIVPDTMVEIIGSMGVQLPLLRTGVAIKHNQKYPAPYKFEVGLSQQEPGREGRQLRTKFFVPQEQTDIVKIEHTPVIYITRCSSNPTRKPTTKEETVYNKLSLPYPEVDFNPIPGVKVHMTMPRSIVRWTPAAVLKGKYTFSTTFLQSTSQEEKTWEITFGYKSNVQKDQSPDVYRNYRSSHERHTSQQRDFLEDLKQMVDERIPMPQMYAFQMVAITTGYQKPLEVSAVLGLVTSISKENWNYQFLMEVGGKDQQIGSFRTNIVADMKKVLKPSMRDPKDEFVADIKFTYGFQKSYESNVEVHIVTGEKGTMEGFQTPYKPYLITLFTKYFTLNQQDIPYGSQLSNEESKEDSWFNWDSVGHYFGYKDNKRESREDTRRDSYEVDSYKSRERSSHDSRRQSSSRRDDTTPVEPESYNYKVDVETTGPYSETLRRTADLITDYIMYKNGGELRTDTTRCHAENKYWIKFRLTPDFEMSKVVAHIPIKHQETCLIKSYQMPYTIWYQKARTLIETPMPASNSLLMGSKSPLSSVCKIEKDGQKDKVQTFDKVIYQLPEDLPTDCETVVAKDCSRSNLWTVLMKKEWQDKLISVLLPDTEIKVVPQSYSPKLVINDEELSLRDDETKEIVLDIKTKDSQEYRSQESSEEKMSPVIVELKKKEKTISIVSQKLGLKVITDGKEVHIEALPYLSGHLCGLCGDYNGDSHREIPEWSQWSQSSSKESSEEMMTSIEKHERQQVKKGEQMVTKFTINKEQCQIPEYISQSQDDGMCHTRPMTVVRQQPEQSKTCFTLDPVNTCKTPCVSQKSHPQTVSFHCLPSKDAYTQYLVEEAKYRVITEMKGESADQQYQVTVDERCRRPHY